jgi:hypothetical protein
MVAQASAERVKKVVAASVQGVEKVSDEIAKVRFLIPSFNAKYPITVRVPLEDADRLQPGFDYTICLYQERLKEGKDGKYLSNYWWGWGGLADGSREDKPESPPSPTEDLQSHTVANRAQVAWNPARSVSIERQQSLIQANLAYWEYIKQHPSKKVEKFMEAAREITQMAKVFALYLETGRPLPEEGSKEP